MVNTTSTGVARKRRGVHSGAGASSNYPVGAKSSTSETLPGEVGTPQERLEILRQELSNALVAGLTIRVGNTSRQGRVCLVILVYDAQLSGNLFEYAPLPEKLPELEGASDVCPDVSPAEKPKELAEPVPA